MKRPSAWRCWSLGHWTSAITGFQRNHLHAGRLGLFRAGSRRGKGFRSWKASGRSAVASEVRSHPVTQSRWNCMLGVGWPRRVSLALPLSCAVQGVPGTAGSSAGRRCCFVGASPGPARINHLLLSPVWRRWLFAPHSGKFRSLPYHCHCSDLCILF